MKLTIIFTETLLLLLMLSAATYGRESRLNIIYTGSMDGELEPCGCSPKTDLGGVARFSGYLVENENELSPYILIDAGNFSAKDTPQGRLKVEAMMKSFSIMKYDVVALLGKEKAFPEDFFLPLLKEYKIPVVSDTSRYSQSISINRGTFNINISVDPKNYRNDRLNILLTDLSIDVSKRIKGWDVIINSSGKTLEEPLNIDKTVIMAGYPKGRKLGILTLQIDSTGKVVDSSHRWQALENDIAEDAGVRNILNDYDAKVAKLLKNTGKPAAGTTYVGVSKCAECHQPFVEGWGNTRHAGAFLSLENAGKSADPECIECHTVGFGEKGGFFTIETTPGLANVQCEACHGLDTEHLSDFSRPMKAVTESVCLKCHTESNSPDFDYTIYLEKIKH